MFCINDVLFLKEPGFKVGFIPLVEEIKIELMIKIEQNRTYDQNRTYNPLIYSHFLNFIGWWQ